MIKRICDIYIALIGLILFSPLYLVTCLLVKQEDRGPILYPGLRVGKRGKTFRMLKFRTMVINADKIGGSSTPEDDLRITRIGKYLRKYKLDELPQLVNVLKGEMSIVGPRPEVPYYVDMYSEKEKAILSVRPGITDWASLWNSDEGKLLAGSSNPEKAYMENIRPTKIKLQLKYVNERSFFTDLSIICQTILKITLKRKQKMV